MNVIINPTTDAPGHSFKGLHNYCAHDTGHAQTSERVDFIETRNLGVSDPEQAYKIMIATAKAQKQLKKAAGVRGGRPNEHGPVNHIILAFDEDEPNSKKDMIKAADEYLSFLGVDPAKQRGQNKRTTRQFADEHQVIMYAHSDTGNHHIHLMINNVHPIHGRNLPDSNDQTKSSDWALEYSKRHGTDHKTPAREENQNARKNGEYVKADKRKSRNLYDLEKALEEAGADHKTVDTFMKSQQQKDRILLQKGRNMKALQARDWNNLIKYHKDTKAGIGRRMQTDMNKAKAETREEYRPQWRTINARQKAERETFEGLEKSFFGKASNIVRTVKLSADLIRHDKTGIITRTFKILSNAGDRKRYFENAQKFARDKLQRQQNNDLKARTDKIKSNYAQHHSNARAIFRVERENLSATHAAKDSRHREEWQARNEARKEAFKKHLLSLKKIKDKFDMSQAKKAKLDEIAARALERYNHKEEFEKSRDHDRDDIERDSENNNDESER